MPKQEEITIIDGTKHEVVDKIICAICKKEITKEHRIMAFGEFTPEDWQWKHIADYDGFDEVIPDGDVWDLAHYYCMVKKDTKDKDEPDTSEQKNVS